MKIEFSSTPGEGAKQMESEGKKSGEGKRGKRIEDPSNILGGDRAEIF